MEDVFYSNGKLLLTGEYLVLDGAVAFALPTVFGQSLKATKIPESVIRWTSYAQDDSVWMSEEVPLSDILGTSTPVGKNTYYTTLVDVLRAAHLQNPRICSAEGGYEVTTQLTFPRLWGLGTSSTWINNIAQWFGINPYQLLHESFGGSGYDIACARHDQPLFYTLTDPCAPEVELTSFNPSFKAQLYFVYLNEKKDSKEAIANFRAKRTLLDEQLLHISAISRSIRTAKTLEQFQDLLVEHETILSEVLGVPTVKERLFSDFSGVVKSLGGWGGDFVLVASADNPTAYFRSKGYDTILPYEQMILSK